MKFLICLIFATVVSSTKYYRRVQSTTPQWYLDPYYNQDQAYLQMQIGRDPYSQPQMPNRFDMQQQPNPPLIYYDQPSEVQAAEPQGGQQLTQGFSLGNRNQDDDDYQKHQFSSNNNNNRYSQTGIGSQNNGVTTRPQNAQSSQNGQSLWPNNRLATDSSGYTSQNQGVTNRPTNGQVPQSQWSNTRPVTDSSGYPAQSQVVTSRPQTGQGQQSQWQSNGRPAVDSSLLFPNSDDTADYNPNNNYNKQSVGRPSSNVAQVLNRYLSPVSTASNKFALNMVKELLKRTDENFVVSPLSLSTLLALLQQGANGKSLKQLTQAVGLTSDDSREEYSSLMNSLKKRGSKNVLEFANGLWVDRYFSLDKNFKNTATRDFKADVQSVDFQRTGSAAQEINRWVSQKTRNIITNMISPANIDPTTAMILVNAIYFKGLWKSPFEPSRTVMLPFSPTPALEKRVPFMHQSGSFVGGQDSNIGAKWLELPFEDNEYCMIFVLPTEQHGLQEMVDRLNVTGFSRMVNSGNVINKVVMSIPRFSLGFESQLNSLLRQLGVSEIFTTNSGLDGISKSQPVYVSKVFQKAQITVDEYGSTAAVSTALDVNTLSLAGSLNEFHFSANQPFLAIIVDKINDVPLFVSRINDPSSLNPESDGRYSYQK